MKGKYLFDSASRDLVHMDSSEETPSADGQLVTFSHDSKHAGIMVVRCCTPQKTPCSELTVLESICTELQKQSANWSCEGVFSATGTVSPLSQMGGATSTQLLKDELCVVMYSKEVVPMTSLLEGMAQHCHANFQRSIVRHCKVNILTDEQEDQINDLFDSYADRDIVSAFSNRLEALSSTPHTEEEEMLALFNIVMAESAASKFFYARFFEQQGYNTMSKMLVLSAALDNYKQAVDYINNCEEF